MKKCTNLSVTDFNEEMNIVPPSTDDEETLCRLLKEILCRDDFGVTTDLFEMGLSSLGSLRLITVAEKNGLKIDLVDIVEYRTVRGILEELAKRHSEVSEEDYALSETRERALPHPVPDDWNHWLENEYVGDIHVPHLMSFGLEADAQRLCDALNRAVANRSVLSMIIEKDSTGQNLMRYDSAFTPHYEVQRLTEQEFETKRAGLLQQFVMYKTPLIHAGIFETEQRVYLFLDIHHIIMDGSALMLFLDDIEKAYRGEALPQDTFFTWLAANQTRQKNERSSSRYKESRDRWLQIFDDKNWRIGFKPDQNEGLPEFEILPFQRVITKDEFSSLVKNYGVGEGLLCIALAILTEARVDGDGDLVCSTIYHNRGDDVSRNAFGMLMAIMPVAVTVRRNSSVAAFFKELNASWIDSLENIYAGMDTYQNWEGAKIIMQAIFQSYETSGADPLSSLGAKQEEIGIGGGRSAQSVQLIERPDGSAVLVPIFNKQLYSPEKLAMIQEALETVIDRIVAVEDPESATLAELLG